MSRGTQDSDPPLPLSPTGLSPSLADLSSVFQLASSLFRRSYNPNTTVVMLVWAVPLSLATTRRILSFPVGTKMFQFPTFPRCAYVFCTP